MDFTQIMEWWSNLPQEQKEKCYSYMNGKKVESKSFDKLKELWNTWYYLNSFETFEMFVWCNYMDGEWMTFIKDTGKQVHKWLAKHCGFLTTAEVRQAIQQLVSFK